MNTQKEKTLINFKKAESHITKVIKMTKDNKYCIDIMQQNLAVIGLLKSAHYMLMESHLNNCCKKALETKSKKIKQEMIEEVLKVVRLSSK